MISISLTARDADHVCRCFLAVLFGLVLVLETGLLCVSSWLASNSVIPLPLPPGCFISSVTSEIRKVKGGPWQEGRAVTEGNSNDLRGGGQTGGRVEI